MTQARYGAGAQRGRRQVLTEEELVELGKSRFFDPEHRRQRRLGMAELALGAGGAAGLLLGGRGIARTSRAARSVTGMSGHSKDDTALLMSLLQRKDGKRRLPTIVARGRDAAAFGGGALSAGGAVGVNRYAESRKGRGWN